MNNKKDLFYLLCVIGALGLGWVLLALYFEVVLHYDFLRSDVLWYWNDSLVPAQPFNSFHVPGYPWMIAALRGITGGHSSPLTLMMSINLAALIAGAFLVYRILENDGAGGQLSALGALLFGLWPAVGLTYSVYPLADIPAMSLLLAGLWLLQRLRFQWAAFFLGLAIITHKAMWFFAICIVAAEAVRRRDWRWEQRVGFAAVMLLPLGALWLLGAWHHGSALWILETNIKAEVASRGTLPFLDGIVGTLSKGGSVAIPKGMMIITLILLTVSLLYLGLRLKYQGFSSAVAISAAVLVLFLILNRHEIWGAVRFSRLLVLPLVLTANALPGPRNTRLPVGFMVVALYVLLMLSQFAFAWYMAKRFFA